MMHDKFVFPAVLILTTVSIAACNDQAREEPVAKPVAEAEAGKPAPSIQSAAATSPGKPSAPISMDYEVLGNPVVGSPVLINVSISASEEYGPLEVRYNIADASALVFQQGQVRSMRLGRSEMRNRQQLAVIPQREGRSFVNVSAEVQTPGGLMIKSIAIPVQVGSAPDKPQINGDLVEGPDGETVISMPAKEN